VHDADGDFDADSDGADGFPALAAGEDGGALVVVDDAAPAADAAPAPGCFEAILGLADDVAVAGGRSRASCCRLVFCLSVLTRTRPMSATAARLSSI
jgi:hypothetical protein